MNKRVIIGALSAALVILLCAVGGIFFALNMNNSNIIPPENNKSKAEETIQSQVKRGWVEENGNWYFYKSNKKQTEWVQKNDAWYYLRNDGKMRTGWIKDKDQWYYLNEDGTMATNVTIDGCYLNYKGIMEDTPSPSKSNTNSGSNSSSQKSNDIGYYTYTNERFGFSIDYPSFLTPGPPPENNDGLEFKSADGMVSFAASGSNNALFYTIEDLYNNQLNYIGVNPSYKHLGSNNYALSWEENGMIHYSYKILGEGSMNTFVFIYPSSKKEYYDPIVNRIYNSFKTPLINEAR